MRRRNRLASTLLFVSIVGCVSTPKLKVISPVGERAVLLSPFVGVDKLTIRRVRVQDAANLRAMVENRRAYRLDFFRQTKDPYFGKNRWSESCLKRNATGTLMDSSDGKYFRNNATANAALQTETCLQDSVDVVQVIGECRAQGLFYEIVAYGAKAANVKFGCPDEILY